jgi:hypothetical protein
MYSSRMQPNINNQIFGPNGFENVWSSTGIGPQDTHGVTLGAYVYTYSKKECQSFEPQFSCENNGNVEMGHYNLNAVSATVGNNRVFISLWNATTGPLRGQVGPFVGLIQTNSATEGMYDLSRSEFNGFFCYFSNDEPSQPLGPNNPIQFSGCTAQVSKHKKKDRAVAQELIKAYSAYLDERRSPLYHVKWLINKVWGMGQN